MLGQDDGFGVVMRVTIFLVVVVYLCLVALHKAYSMKGNPSKAPVLPVSTVHVASPDTNWRNARRAVTILGVVPINQLGSSYS